MKLFGWGNAPEPEPSPEPEPQKPDRLEQLEATVGSLTSTLNSYFERQTAQAQPQPQLPAAPPPVDDIDEETLAAALDEGGAVAVEAMNKRLNANNERMRRENNNLLGAGLSTLDQVTMQMAQQSMPWYSKDAVIKEQVDAELAKLPPEHRVALETKKEVYNWVVGRNAARLEELVRADALRQQAAVPEPVGGGGSRSSRALRPNMAASGADITPAEVFGAESIEVLREKGLDPDSFAASLPADNVREVDSQTGVRKNRTVNYRDFKGYVDSARGAVAKHQRQNDRYLGRA